MTNSFIPETNYRSLFHSLPGFHVFIHADDTCFKITDVTSSFLDKTGLQRQAVLGKSVTELFLTEETVLAGWLNATLSGTSDEVKAAEYRAFVKIKYPPNHTFPAETASFRISVYPVLNERREIIAGILQLEAQVSGDLGESFVSAVPGQYGISLFDDNPAAVFTLNSEGDFLTANKAMANLLEIAQEDLLKTSLCQFVVPADLQRIHAYYDQALTGLQCQFEASVITSKGKRLLLSICNTPVIVNRIMMGVYWIASDITASKQTEQLLTAERDLYKLFIDNSLDGWISGAPDGRIFQINPAARVIFGYSEEELKSLGRNAIFDKRASDFPAKLNRRNRDKYIKTELTGIRKNGERFPLMISSLIYHNPKGEERTCNFISDISNCKKIESDLLHAESLLRQAESIARLGSWEYDLINCRHTWSDELFRIFGLEPQSFEPTSDRLLMICHPDDRESMRIQFENTIINKTDYYLRIRATRADGSRCVILSQGKLILNAAGHPSKLYGFTRDITDQVIADEILEASEEKYRTVFHQSPQPKWIFDLETLQILEVNAAAISHYGYSAAEFIGLTIKDLRPPEDHHLLAQAMKELEIPDRDVHAPLRHRKKNGELIYVEITGVRLDYSGRKAMIVTCNDVTEKLNYQHALMTSNVRYNYAMKASFDAIWDWDFAKKTVYRGEGYTRLFGHAVSGFVSTIEEWQQHIHPEDSKRVIDGISAALLSGQDTWSAQYRLCKADQTYAYVNDRGSIILDSKGEAYRMIGAMQDISRQKEEEQEREKLIEELLRINTDLQQFSYITSHNLKSPLANLISILSIMDISEIRNEETLLLIDGLEKSTKQLNDTLNDLHQILVVKQNTNYNVKELNFAETWQRTQNLVTGLISAAGAEIVSDFNAAPVLNFNKVYLESILLNLLSNSLKYRSPERKVRIELESTETPEHVVLSFRDNGLGIDLKRHGHKIFGLYQRFHTLPGGRGLGLYMISSQLQALGGKIEVESQVNQGTCFKLSFPKLGG